MQETVLRRTGSQLRLPLLGPTSDDAEVQSPADVEGGSSVGSPTAATITPLMGASLWQTVFNIANIYVGLGLLTIPYAVQKGGWTALGLLALLVPLFGFSGQLICTAFDCLPPRAPRSYPELGRVAAGAAGQRAVLVFCGLELFGATVMLLMVAWQMLELLLPTEGLGPLHPTQLAAVLTTAGLAPLLFSELRRLGPLAMLGSASTALVLAMVLALLVLDPSRSAMPQQPPPGHHTLSAGIIQSFGIFALSCSAHSTLPALRSSMSKPARFPAALAISFAAMFTIYCMLGGVGYWYFGDGAAPLVTTNLALDSYYTKHPSIPVDRLLAVCVLLSCFAKYPSLNLILQDMILSVLPLTRDAEGAYCPPLRWVTAALRLAIFGAGTALALGAYSALGAALSLLGGLCSINCSLVLPTAFYMLLRWRHLRWASRAGLVATLCLGLSLVVLVTAMNVCALLPSCHARVGVAHDAWAALAAPLPLGQG